VEWDENDGEERIEIERGRVLFAQMVQLSQILAEILETFYTLQAAQAATNAGAQATQLILSLAKPIQLKLKEWYSALPGVVRMDSSFQSPGLVHQQPSPRFSSIGYLHLAYFATEITLHRGIIRSMDTSSAGTPAATAGGGGGRGSTTPTANPVSPSPFSVITPGGVGVGVEPYVQHICRSAAKARLISAMDFVNRLTPSHLRSFWYFASKTNFALIGTFGSLLWATSPGREEADWYRRRLAEYRWTLSVSSKPGEGKGLTEFAMGMLDISTGLLKKLPEKPSLSRSGSAVDIDAARRQSLLALGGTGNTTTSGLSRMGLGMGGHGFGGGGGGGEGQHSAEASVMQSPPSEESESSEEGVYGNFSATAGMAGMGD
jgi:hypothetical protein